MEIQQDIPIAPSEYDTLHGVEEGDNRLTNRMFEELMDLQSEGKLDYEQAGRELDRSPEVLKRICSQIRRVPPIETFDSNMDLEAVFHMSKSGKPEEQLSAFGMTEVFGESMRAMTKAFVPGAMGKATNYDKNGALPETIPARGFKSPKGRHKTYSETEDANPYDNHMP